MALGRLPDMSESAPFPRYRMGEIAYQGLWWAIVLLPAAFVLLRLPTQAGGTFFLYGVVGLPATIAGQIIAGMMARGYRLRQWRHFLGPVASRLSLAYYAAWLLLALTMPDRAAGVEEQAPIGALFGAGFAGVLTGLLMATIVATYLGLLVAIFMEGERAVRHWAGAPRTSAEQVEDRFR